MENRPVNNRNRNQSNSSSKPVKASGIVVLTVLAVCIVFFVARGLFSSNSDEIPEGYYTGTINTAQTTVAPAQPASTTAKASDKKADDKKAEDKNDSKADENAESEAEESTVDNSSAKVGDTLYVTEESMIHSTPAQDGEVMVYATPNQQVTLLEKGDEYWKVSFQYDGETYEGYLWNGYLATKALS